MQFDILTLFPESFESYLNSSMMKRAQKSKRVRFRVHNIRDYATDKHHITDDRPYGGGAGMVMKVEPIWRALRTITKARNHRIKKSHERMTARIFLMSPRGKQFDQRMAEKFAKFDQLVLICGHYEGVDERVKKFIDGEISAGPYVLTGGELPAMTIVDAVSRLVPGVLGNARSLEEESFGRLSLRAERSNLTSEASSRAMPRDFEIAASSPDGHRGTPRNDSTKEYPHYTRPEIFTPQKGTMWRVPKVLLTGDHKKIEEWRQKHSK